MDHILANFLQEYIAMENLRSNIPAHTVYQKFCQIYGRQYQAALVERKDLHVKIQSVSAFSRRISSKDKAKHGFVDDSVHVQEISRSEHFPISVFTLRPVELYGRRDNEHCS